MVSSALKASYSGSKIHRIPSRLNLRLKEDINKLETELKGHQVDEINELLAWVIFGKRVLTIEELEAALVSS